MTRRMSVLFLSVVMLFAVWVVAGCGDDGGTAPEGEEATETIKIGASLPMTGPLSTFGLYLSWGYQHAIDEVNEQGGLQLASGKKANVELVILDNESAPEKATANIERLALREGVVALLGPATPPLVIPAGGAAEEHKLPMIATNSPIQATTSARDWTFLWTTFFDELDMTTQQFKTMDTVESNKKVALFTDNEQDGVVMGGLWEEKAPEFGYEVVYRANFPVGTTDYSDVIRRAQASGADIVICQMITPDSVAMFRQAESMNWKPKAIFIEKGADPQAFWDNLGPSAQGVGITGYWDPGNGFPGSDGLREAFEQEKNQQYGPIIGLGYSISKILLDAIARADSLEGEDINAAIAQTDADYAIGHVKFNENNAWPIPAYMDQWQDGERKSVFNERGEAAADFIYPLPSWQELKQQ